jgi:hypothetical protein
MHSEIPHLSQGLKLSTRYCRAAALHFFAYSIPARAFWQRYHPEKGYSQCTLFFFFCHTFAMMATSEINRETRMTRTKKQTRKWIHGRVWILFQKKRTRSSEATNQLTRNFGHRRSRRHRKAAASVPLKIKQTQRLEN